MRAGVSLGLLAALAAACQSYNMEAVDPQTVVAVETAGTFSSSRAPVLLIVQDRSGSMKRCFGQKVDSSHLCDADGNSGDLEMDGRMTRMEVARQVLSGVVQENSAGVRFGLVAYGLPDASGCGPADLLVAPGSGTAPAIVGAYGDEVLTAPGGGTPTTAALSRAYEVLVDDSGKLREPDRKNYVLLVTDGLMNCNTDYPADQECRCYNEGGCSGGVAYGDPIPSPDQPFLRAQCLDIGPARTEVERLRAAGVSTFVIGLGDDFSGTGDLAVETLNDLAVAGGVPRDGSVKFFPGGDPAALEASLGEIVSSITAPCVYDLDGSVCDGRLVSVSLTVTRTDGAEPQVIETHCDAGGGENTWFFADGSPRRLAFDPALCRTLEDAVEVKISIRGVQNECPDGVAPSCGPPSGP